MSRSSLTARPLASDTNVPATLQRATLRLNFPPSYVVVGVYRLFTDKSLYRPAWDKCKHGARRGLIVGFAWTCLTYRIQRHIVRSIISNPTSLLSLGYITRLSQTATDLSEETFLGFKLPFNISTYVTILLLGAQVTTVITFFLSRNIRIARQRAWDQTVASRGKGADFWQPYVEEWEVPPAVHEGFSARLGNVMEIWVIGVVVKKVLLLPLSLYPFLGTFVAAGIKALGTAQHLHKPYFKAKNMTPHQVAVFIEERKWDYRLFGFAAALLEGIPIIGLAFTVSNRIGAAMWAHDLEKRQHYIAAQRSGRSEDVAAMDKGKSG
ncbi:hypothetical protein PAXINDRAFT_121307 [Paxillus involutus ATCC 200175]|uniref:Unplaced genomic scaffold PAXINscaffold_735, whole genome shotgun sequence n=1 Tax=Paxillus involutus ATCC 200175 TaxID=664439 RepID=A0A0C9SMY9_PAXIN|nr:hypothetical protein PAXINDRAFT_121307 [Paxillus involutus ATCC 200175]